MKIEVNFEKKGLFVILVAALIIAGAIVVYAYNSIPNPGHGADSIKVLVGNDELTLQDAITQGKIGGTGNIINGSGIIFTQVAGKTMINVSEVALYQCPNSNTYTMSESQKVGCPTPPSGSCYGQLTLSDYCTIYTCNSNYQWVNQGTNSGCTLIGNLVK